VSGSRLSSPKPSNGFYKEKRIMLKWKKGTTGRTQLASSDGRFRIEGHWDKKPGYYELVDTKTNKRERNSVRKKLKEHAEEIVAEEAGPPWREFRTYVEELKRKWTVGKRVDSKEVYEVMNARDRERVDNIIDAWGRYITPFAEAWWKERGYGVVWPDDNSEPMQVVKLDA
jgi:hypothetical protein